MVPALVAAFALQLVPPLDPPVPPLALGASASLVGAGMTPELWAASGLMLAGLTAGLVGTGLLGLFLVVALSSSPGGLVAFTLLMSGVTSLVAAGGCLGLAELERTGGGGAGPPGRRPRDVRPEQARW